MVAVFLPVSVPELVFPVSLRERAMWRDAFVVELVGAILGIIDA
jgi:hypothetical protein